MIVPKIIWQTHEYEYDELPDHLQQVILTWIYLNKDWVHKYVSAKEREEFISNEYPEVYHIYKQVDNIGKADIWRYAVIHKYGGVYADMDSVCISSLDDNLSQIPDDIEILTTPYGHQSGGINNANFAGKRGAKPLRILINEIKLKWRKEHPGQTTKLFTKVMLDRPDVSNEFRSEAHSEVFKDSFSNDYYITYDGKQIKYYTFLKKYIHIDGEKSAAKRENT